MGHPENTAPTKTVDMAAANDRLWERVCAALGWKYNPTV